MVDTDPTWLNAENQSPHSIQERPLTLRAATLWPFVLAVYNAPQAKTYCLKLQNEAHMDVCLLLWRLWLYAYHRMPNAEAAPLISAHHHWQHRYTTPLRSLRQRVKPWTKTGARPWYNALLHTELIAERTALLQLAQGSTKGAIVKLASQRQAELSVLHAYPALSRECHTALMQLIIITDDVRITSL